MGPCHHGMARPHVAVRRDGLLLGEGLTTPPRGKPAYYENVTQGLGIFGTTYATEN